MHEHCVYVHACVVGGGMDMPTAVYEMTWTHETWAHPLKQGGRGHTIMNNLQT